jgi:hypothetical protein
MQNQTKEQLRKEVAFQQIVERERARTDPEKYHYRSLKSGWMAAPGLLVFIGGIALFWILHASNYVDPTFATILVIDMAVLLVIVTYDNQWKERLKAKDKIAWEAPPPRHLSDYNSDYNYTDSALEPKLYLLAKIACYLVSIAATGVVVLLLFSWLGTISVAPTTIIIVLLVIIIFNQERGNRP